MKTPRFLRVLSTALAGVALLAVTAGSASAQSTVGELAPSPTAGSYCQFGPFDLVPGGSSAFRYAVPTKGVITSWSTRSSPVPGQELTFKVFRPAGGAAPPKFTVAAQDGPKALVPGSINTFATEIPVMPGDLIGLNNANAASVPNYCVFATGDPGDGVWVKKGEAGAGETFEAESGQGEDRLDLTATILVAPTIASVSPSTGSPSVPTTITIAGTEFAHVREVTVGAASVPFSVTSETSITATAPAGSAGASVTVGVTTAAGTATAAFSYQGAVPIAVAPTPVSCKVPRLEGRKLKVAMKALAKANCKLGTVTRRKGAGVRKAKVVGQQPKPGTTRSSGSKVNVTLG
jgi:hypothetical protein